MFGFYIKKTQILLELEWCFYLFTISVCIQNKNTIDELAFMDMLFQPNYDNPFNYLNLVAQQAVAKERDENKKKN